ncbi:inositol transporter 2 isoform B [Micractinium conductrix]|uniref:Inositol transporter 2 isoform B n=1 Tax=Micractinium conductrix TaxID=554055 RepID=A0A2P6V9R1_9CHLO|nr:inositol transporter 2 isoform B [Micractinium conductrix]|eukprot:PSC70824.1 inositol transporter 2 isoform B [Micractinium conductrix]
MLALVAAFASVAGFLFGYDLGLIGGALLNIRDAFGMGDWMAELIVGAAKFGAVLGTFLGGALMLHYGRRIAIAIDSAFFIVGPLIMAASAGVAGLVVGRVVVGVGIGIAATVVPAYLGEVAPAKVRGRVVESFELLLCAGMLAAALGDAAFQPLPGNWRWMVGAPVVPALVLSLALCLLPESPRWLVIRGKLDEALAVIHRVYTSKALPAGMQHSTAEVEEELMQLWSSVEKDREAAAAQRAQHAERQRRRQEQRETRVAPLADAPTGAAAGEGERARVRWQRLQVAEDEEGEQEGEQGEAAAVEAGAAGVERCMQTAAAAAAAAGESAAEGHAESGRPSEQRSLLPGGGGSDAAEQRQRGGSPLPAPPALPRIRTAERSLAELQGEEVLLAEATGNGSSSAAAGASAEQQQQQQQQQAGASPQQHQQQGAAPPAQQAQRKADEWCGSGGSSRQLDPGAPGGEERQPVTARAGAAQAGFWRTLGNMLGDIAIVASGPERQALQVLERAGVESHSAAALLSSAVGGSKLLGVLLSFFLVDSLGRRPLLVWGSAGCALALAGLALADWFALRAFLIAGMCTFIFAFSVSWAGVFWVLLSELFSMSAKSPAASAATAALFLTGAVADTLFLTLHNLLGPFVFLLFALLAAAAGLYVAAVLPETRGRTLQEVQSLLALRAAPGSRHGAWFGRRRRGGGGGAVARRQERGGLLPTGALRSDAPLPPAGSLELPPAGQP